MFNKRKTHFLWLATTMMAVCFGCRPRVEPSKFYIPYDYQGSVYVEYGIPDKPSIELVDGYYIYKIPETGLLQTSSDFEETRAGISVPDTHFYYDPERGEVTDSTTSQMPIEDITIGNMNGIADCPGRKHKVQHYLVFSVNSEKDRRNICRIFIERAPDFFSSEEL